MERYTSCTVELDLFDTTAKSDSSYTVDNIQDFSNIEKIREANDIVKIATLENNYFLLDGSYSFKDDVEDLTEHVGYMSKLFESSLHIDFTMNHSSIGTTFHFWDVYPYKIDISYKKGNKLLKSGTFYPDNLNYVALITADDYDNMDIVFYSNDRYIRLNNIDYGVALYYGEGYSKALRTCSLTEEIDVTSSEISVNESMVEVIDQENYFKITNPKSYYKYLQKRQLFTISEIIDDKTFVVAKHFLKEWSQTDEHLAKFTLQDVIGLMTDTEFKGGMYENVQAGEVIREIMEDYGYDKYTVDDNVSDMIISGHIPICSHREALQQVAFACMAVVDTTKDDFVKIYRPTYESVGLITKDRKLMSNTHQTTQEDLVTGVMVVSHSFLLEEEKQIYKKILSEGNHTITFNRPCADISVVGATVIEGNCNYVVVNVVSEGEVIMYGKEYLDLTNEHHYTELDDLPTATDEKLLTVDSAELVSETNVLDVAKNLYYISQYRLNHVFKAVTVDESVGKMYSLATGNNYSPCLITKMTTDLTGGYVSNFEGVGYALRENEAQYTTYPTYELFLGDGGIL